MTHDEHKDGFEKMGIQKEEYIGYDHIKENLKIQIHRCSKQSSGCLGLGWWEDGESLLKDTRFLLGRDENILKLDTGASLTTCEYSKSNP